MSVKAHAGACDLWALYKALVCHIVKLLTGVKVPAVLLLQVHGSLEGLGLQPVWNTSRLGCMPAYSCTCMF